MNCGAMTEDTSPERIYMTEGSVELPPGFEDRTTNIFKPGNPETSPNLSIARDWLDEHETLAGYVDRQLAQLKKHLPTHKLLDRGEERLGQGEAMQTGERVDAQYKSGGRPVYQRQAVFKVAPLRALIFTASSPKPLNEEFHALWRQWLDGFRPAAADAQAAGDDTPAANDEGEPPSGPDDNRSA